MKNINVITANVDNIPGERGSALKILPEKKLDRKRERSAMETSHRLVTDERPKSNTDQRDEVRERMREIEREERGSERAINAGKSYKDIHFLAFGNWRSAPCIHSITRVS